MTGTQVYVHHVRRAETGRVDKSLIAASRPPAEARIRPDLLSATARKQPGRRYGPAPKNAPKPQMQAPAPLDADTRWWHYTAGLSRCTARQARQFDRMAYRNGGAPRTIAAKGSPTPTQKKARR